MNFRATTLMAACCLLSGCRDRRSPEQAADDPCDAANRARVQSFEAMIGKNPEELLRDHGSELLSLIAESNPEPFRAEPWHVWRSEHVSEEAAYVVFFGRPIVMIPGISSAQVLLFDHSGSQLARWAFSTGWRIDLLAAEFRHDEKLETDLMILKTAPKINGRPIGRQIFALTDNQLFLLRIEDTAGKLVRNNYFSPNHTLGASLPAASKDEWVRILRSADPARRLAALTYIGGIHMDPDHPRIETLSESLDDAKVAKALREDETTQTLLTLYTHSKLDWIREAALLAQVPDVRNW